MTITISISDDTWRELVDRKQPGESFDSVIQTLIKQTQKAE